ncbi:MAG: aspartate/glutamate racemase family protein [Alphaproteobacteria bacterium]|nr:aspartate/glutamate racemase family protein [Alphaproteobacteria bacterium]
MTDMKPDGGHIAQGGKAIQGASVGILMLEARFPRIPGDMGNALTWPFPVHYRVVRGASPDRVVRQRAEGLLEDFIAAARELVADGVDGITTNCGFLSLFQDELAAAAGVPVATSSLMQAPMIQATLPPGKRVGILTISADTLTEEHLRKAGVPDGTPVVGTEGGREFSRIILNNEESMNVEAARQDLVEAGRELAGANPEVGAILLECTNMVPYAADINRVTGLPVFSIYSFVTWFQSALQPRAGF